MTERPILFSGPMVRAILDGKKTMTRRVVKPQPSAHHWHGSKEYNQRAVLIDTTKGTCLRFSHLLGDREDGNVQYMRCPYGKRGDRLWVRETWCQVDDREFGGQLWIDYRSTPSDDGSHPAGWHNAPDDAQALKWRPSIHMPRSASRILLEITGIRVERLQEITEEDALAEGCEREFKADGSVGWGAGLIEATANFKILWNGINEKRGYSWESNPWVWVIEFKRITP